MRFPQDLHKNILSIVVITSKEPSLFYLSTEKFLVFFKKFSVLSVYREQEIDFYATKDGKSYLVQVAYSIADEDTYNREFALFNKLDQSMRKIIITNDDIDFSTSTVQHIMLKDFLSMNDLEG